MEITSDLRIAIVAPRFSREISGGAERLIIQYAEILSEFYDVTVLTSYSLDYETWRNQKESQKDMNLSCRILRFETETERNIDKFNRSTNRLFKKWKRGNLQKSEQYNWVESQGPYVPELVQYIENHRNDFEVFLFLSYLYFPTVMGMKLVKNKSVLIPTLHDEFPAYLPIYRELFTDEISYCFNAPEEQSLFETIYGFHPSNHAIVGMSVDSKPNTESDILQRFGLSPGKYCVYIGRMDVGKGSVALVEYFLKWSEESGIDSSLVLIGSGNHVNVDSNQIVFTGYVSEEEKHALLENAICLMNPSGMESFSVVLMEAWLHEIPVLVNKASDVLKGHCERSNGGLYYSDYEDFSETLTYLWERPRERKIMGRNGKRYVELNFNRNRIVEKLTALMESTSKKRFRKIQIPIKP